MENENNQLKSELETHQGYSKDQDKKIEHLTQCVHEANSVIHVKEKEIERIKRVNE